MRRQTNLKNKIKDIDFEQFMAVLFLSKYDETKYGKSQDEYRMDYANKKDNYPKSMVNMVDVMRQVKISRKKNLPSDKEIPMMMRKRIWVISLRRVFLKRKGIICNF